MRKRPSGSRVVLADRDAVVGALAVARGRRHRARAPRRDDGRDQRARSRVPRPTTEAPAQREPDDHEQPPDADDERARRHEAEQHEAREERPGDRAAVPIADSRPTIEPLVARSTRVARTIIGPTADSRAAGSTKPTVARVTIATKSVAEARGPRQRDDRDRRRSPPGRRARRSGRAAAPVRTRPRPDRRARPRARCPPGSRR